MRAFFKILAVILAMLAPAAARAVPITVQYQGVVTSVGTALPPTIAVGDPITGVYTFDSTTPNTFPSSLSGFYATTHFQAAVGSFFFVSTSAQIFVHTPNGEYAVTGLGGAGDLVNGNKLDTFELVTSSPTEITTTDLPLVPPQLGTYHFALSFGLPPGQGEVNGDITAVSIQVPENVAVAEPPGPAGLLACFGALLLAGGSRGLRRAR